MMNLREKRLFLLDMDGTLYIGDALLPGAAEFLRTLRETGRLYRFLTNNSSKGTDAYIDKLARLGIEAAPEEFVTSADVTLAYLQEHYRDQKLYVLGTRSLREHFRRGGLRVTDELADDVGALVLGFDTELTFAKLEDACILLGRGVDYLATHPDLVCPTAYGSVPDCGALADMLETATGRRPLSLGKPAPAIVDMAMDRAGCGRGETVLVGDRLYTDIASGVNAGVDTVLVLSGEATREDAEASQFKPTAIVGGVSDMLAALG